MRKPYQLDIANTPFAGRTGERRAEGFRKESPRSGSNPDSCDYYKRSRGRVVEADGSDRTFRSVFMFYNTQIAAALDVINNDDTAGPLIREKVRALMIGYDAHWSGAKWKPISEEELFHVPVMNPETGKAMRRWTYAGLYDGIVEYEGRTFLREAKTTSDDIADPDAPYWRRLDIDSQISSYTLSNWQLGREIDGILYDVIKKPTIRPKAISKADQKEIRESGTYCGFAVPDSHLLAEREDEHLYGLRLLADIESRSERYYHRKVLHRINDELLEFANELHDVGQQMRETYRAGRHYRNSGACVLYNRPCQFLGICSGRDDVDSDNWQRAECVHDELTLPEGEDGRSILTNSRCRTFMTCQRKEFYQYHLGLRRVNSEGQEALVFGSLWHAAQEAWWKHGREERIEDVDSNFDPLNEGGTEFVNAVSTGDELP